MSFDPYSSAELKGVKMPSRIIRSATHEGMADENGKPLESLISTYEKYARGGAGLIITGYIAVSQQGKCPLYNMTMLNTDDNIPAFKELTDRVHAAGAPIFAQIAHCGRQTRKKVTGMNTVAPSAIRDFLYWETVPHELNQSEIHEITDDFVAAMKRAKAAGFDGVQVHCAHGYLLSEFLSPHMNHRTDCYGGSTENRFRIVGEIMEKARKELGEDYPIIVKMNSSEKDSDGIKPDEAVKIAELMEQAGFDAIEVSCAIAKEGFNMSRGQFPYESMCADNFRFENLPAFTWPMMKPVMKMLMESPQPTRSYNVEAAGMIKKAVNVPVIVVGGIRSDAEIKAALDGKADFVSMSRPFIIEPDIVNKLKSGKQTESRCINCNYCLMGSERRPMRCYYGKLYKGK